ncbi:MAG: GntR family transcriptional regulator, partial [Ruthenibacterium sp.]
MLEYHSLSDLIYAELKKRIVFSQYAPEAKLEIDQIAKEFGVSRTPVINALRTLEKDGYVVIVPRSGTHVRRYSAEEIEALFDFREALECVVVRKSIHSADPAELKKFMAALEETLQKTQREQGTFDVDGYYDLQSEFHAYLWN